jgi:hypothetical protein
MPERTWSATAGLFYGGGMDLFLWQPMIGVMILIGGVAAAFVMTTMFLIGDPAIADGNTRKREAHD